MPTLLNELVLPVADELAQLVVVVVVDAELPGADVAIVVAPLLADALWLSGLALLHHAGGLLLQLAGAQELPWLAELHEPVVLVVA